MRTDPTDNGGLFVGRRPGTRPVKYRALPKFADARRQMLDRCLAAGLLVVMAVVNLMFWGPLPVAWMWVGSQVDYGTSSTFLGIITAFMGLLFTLLLGLVLLRRLDSTWILVRRAAGVDQREGTLGRIFVVTCGIGTLVFVTWFIVFSGTEVYPVGIRF
ncbi:MAG: hypothetical protein QOK04_604 [Solirubrobacteraceae bacterium]|jgi:hypothetical protein|nr:hypothetical protein [Solirubrobacteraceae bacterium]